MGQLSSDQVGLVQAACSALGEVGRRGVMPMPHTTATDGPLRSLVDKLLAKLQADTQAMKVHILLTKFSIL